jgi:hypothetical protein
MEYHIEMRRELNSSLAPLIPLPASLYLDESLIASGVGLGDIRNLDFFGFSAFVKHCCFHIFLQTIN